MSKYARVVDGLVVEVVNLGEFSPGDVFTPELANEFVPCDGSEVAQGWGYSDGEFFPPTATDISLSDAKAARIALLTSSCAAAIVGGYKSSALGNRHLYPSGMTDQINMMGSVTESLLPNLPANWHTPFWCKDEAGSWGFRSHNASEIQAAGSDGKAHVVACQATLAQLSEDVLTSTSVDEVNAISWSV